VQAGIGGTVSMLTGGSFSNGATNAAYQYLFNYLSEEMISQWSASREAPAWGDPSQNQMVIDGALLVSGPLRPALVAYCIAQGLGCTAADILPGGKQAGGAASALHRNKVDRRHATLYAKFDRDGNFEKWGITHHKDPNKRYTRAERNGGDVERIARRPRSWIIKMERELVQSLPGSKNREWWTGKGP
jgi:hypothetical protein